MAQYRILAGSVAVTSAAAAAGFWTASETPLAITFSVLATVGVLGFVLASGTTRAGLGLRLKWWWQRRRFRPQQGWQAAGAPRGLGMTLVSAVRIPGCRNGPFSALLRVRSGQFVHDELPADGRLPQLARHTRVLSFPAHFEVRPPFPKPVTLHLGKYHVCWFGWRYQGVTVGQVPLAIDSFEVNQD
jgi:hypothetical protein